MPLSPTDRLFLMQCEAAKKESHDPNRQVGVVIVSPTGHLLASGSNRPPEAVELTLQESHREIAKDPNWKYFMLEHAERNAINNARGLGHSLIGATMYGTLFPCADCARAIAAAGIRRLVVPPPEANPLRDEKWQSHFHYARQILGLSGVEVDFVAPADIADLDERSRSVRHR
jgi:dCMP deaminase